METVEMSDHPTLLHDFEECEKVINKLDDDVEPVTPDQVTSTIKKLEEMQAIVASSDMMSANDSLDDLSANSMRLLLIEVYLGKALEHIYGSDRLKQLQRVKKLYNGFLITADVYGFSPVNEGLSQDSDERVSGAQVTDALARSRKIHLYSLLDELSGKVKHLHYQVTHGADDATKREYSQKTLRLWCLKAVRYTDLLNREIEMLQYREQHPEEGTRRADEKKIPLKTTFIPKRETEQQQVFGLGYPSRPTQSVADWYDQQVRSGRFPGSSTQGPVTISGEERQHSDDDEEPGPGPAGEAQEETERQRQMRMDAFKDTHPKGWGNTYGKG